MRKLILIVGLMMACGCATTTDNAQKDIKVEPILIGVKVSF